MTVEHFTLDMGDPNLPPSGRCDIARVEATTEADIARHMAEDDAELMRDVARYARRVRKRLGFSQVEFAERIEVSLDTIRNWEQGKRCPTGAAKALLRVLDMAPEAALAALATPIERIATERNSWE
ncbi:MAG: helix-turn-helix domain-containing protein [Gemmatimonadaceae bacterium]|jgi:putative transcriptional regulator